MFIAAALLSETSSMGSGDCEALHSGGLTQPVSAFSSLAYIIIGAVIISQARRLSGDQRHPSWVYAGLLVAVGLGSVDFHGPQTAGAQLFHDLPIVLLIGFILGLLVFRWLRGRTMFPGFSRRNIGALAVVGVLAGVGLWLGRTDSPVCNADSVWQAHGAWHVLSALVFLIGWQLLFNEGRAIRPEDGIDGTDAETRDDLGKGPS